MKGEVDEEEGLSKVEAELEMEVEVVKIGKERGCVFYQWAVRCSAVLELGG